MARIKFYQGTEKRTHTEGEDFFREYFAIGKKLLAVDGQVKEQFKPEYEEFSDLVAKKRAPKIDDSGEELKIVPEKESVSTKVKKVFSKKKSTKNEGE